jgi:predicted phage replisome organizer
MDISWIKLKTKMFDDEKIQLIEAMPEADAILVIWIKLLIQAGKTNSNGFILLAENIPYSTEMLSTIFRRPLQIVKFALKVLSDMGMIEVSDNNILCITNWEKHQNVDGLDKIREQNRIRVAKYRENQKNVTLHVTQGNATDKELDLDKETEKKKKKEEPTHPLQIFISENLPTVSKLKDQLTVEQCEKIVNELPETIVKEVLESMENYKPLLKKYKSVNSTLRNWIKIQMERSNGNSGNRQSVGGNNKAQRGTYTKEQIEQELFNAYGPENSSELFEQT